MNTDLAPEVAAWVADAMPEGTDTPCGHYNATTDSVCGATPTRYYIPGRRCYHHQPAKAGETR